MRGRSRRIATVLVGFFVLAAAGFAAALLVGSRPLLVSGFLKNAVGGPFTLVADSGRPVTERDFRGKWLLVFFGYTHCADVCPETLHRIAAALGRLGPAAAEVQPLFITVDPRRDTPQVLARYVTAIDPRIVGLTGTPQQIAAVAAAYKVYYSPGESAAQRDYAVDHSAFVYVMDPRGRFAALLRGSSSARDIAARLDRLMRTSR